MNIITKDFPVTASEESDEYPHGSFDVILSAPTLDRDGEIIDARAFEPLPDHVTFDTDHSMTCDSVVGSGTPYYADDGTLHVRGGFAADERSQTIRQKVTDRHIRTTSVTFMDAEREKDEKGVVHIKRAELLNGTFTPIPSNREAVVVTAKSIVAQDTRANRRQQRTKSIIGSTEAQRDRVCDALDDAYDRWTCVRGVLPSDGGGTVIFDSYDDNYNNVTYSQPFTDDGDVVTLTGERVEVDVMEIVLPDADANRDAEIEPKSADNTAEPAADAAGSAEKSADTAEVEALARISEHAAELRFG